MNKKIVPLICISWFMCSLFPTTLVTAKTVSYTPTEETEVTVPKLTDDILKDKTEVPPAATMIDEEDPKEPTDEDNGDVPPSTGEESETEVAIANNEEQEVEMVEASDDASLDISNYALTDKLVEGKDINAQFAQILRSTGANKPDKLTTISGKTWAGIGKEPNQLTKGDMADIEILNIKDREKTLTGELKGIEYATNLLSFSCINTGLTTISVNHLPDLIRFDVSSNLQLKSIVVSDLPKLAIFNSSSCSQVATLDLTDLTEIYWCVLSDMTGLTKSTMVNNTMLIDSSTLAVTGLSKLKDLTIKNIPRTSFDISIFSALETAMITDNASLTSLDCRTSPVKYLTVSNNPKLTSTGFKFSSGSKMVTFTVNNNKLLKELVVTGQAALKELYCQNNESLTKLDVSKNTLMTKLYCSNNKISTLNGTNDLTALKEFDCSVNQLQSLYVEYNKNLEILKCASNQFPNIDRAKNITTLKTIDCSNNLISTLDISNKTGLISLNCSNNVPMTDLTVSNTQLTTDNFIFTGNTGLINFTVVNNDVLTKLDCSTNFNKLNTLIVTDNEALEEVYCQNNKSITKLDVSDNGAITKLYCSNNKISTLNGTNDLTALKEFDCSVNQLKSLYVEYNTSLEVLKCGSNQFPDIDRAKNIKTLKMIDCSNNLISTLDVSKNTSLQTLNCSNNYISDITSANGLTALTTLNASNQTLVATIPAIVNKQASLARTKTTFGSNLRVTSATVSPGSWRTDDIKSHNQILFDGVTKNSFFQGTSKNVAFSYSNLQEGATGGTKSFTGVITFTDASEVTQTLVPDAESVNQGQEISWTWTIKNDSSIATTETITALNLPAGLLLVSGSVTDGSDGKLADEVLSENQGALVSGGEIVLKFKTTAAGNGEQTITSEIKWKDSSSNDSRTDTIKPQVTIIVPGSLELISSPNGFDYGTRLIHLIGSPLSLRGADYGGKTEDFYVRVQDTRKTSTGWKVTEKLSELIDSQHNDKLASASLNLTGLTLDGVTNPNTPEEEVISSPVGKPSALTSATLVAGGGPQTLINAKVNEGREAWRLTMPFDQVSLTVPENNGVSGYEYQGTVTWSLTDTPD